MREAHWVCEDAEDVASATLAPRHAFWSLALTQRSAWALELAREMGMLRMGAVALDGTKIHANASRHSALSYEHAGKIEEQLKAEVAELLARAEAADQADVPDGLSIPDELARREKRLAKLAEARAKIEARAKERFSIKRRIVEVHAEVRLAVNGGKFAVRAAIEGAGLLQAPFDYVRADLAAGRLVTVLDDWAPPPLEGMFLYYPSRRQIRPALKALVDFLRVLARDGDRASKASSVKTKVEESDAVTSRERWRREDGAANWRNSATAAIIAPTRRRSSLVFYARRKAARSPSRSSKATSAIRARSPIRCASCACAFG